MQNLMTAGVVVGFSDYGTIPARVWADLILWREAEAVRAAPTEGG